MSKDTTPPKRITASTMLELKAAIYAHHGWANANGESTTGRISALYDLSANTHVGLYVATPKSAASAEPDDIPPLDDRATYPAGMVRRLIHEDRARRIAPVAQDPTESVLIDGAAYTIPAPVAAELLRLHIELKQAAPASGQDREHEKEQAVIEAAMEWWTERGVRDWGDIRLAKAVATLAGDWPGCDECNHQCGEDCRPMTVAEQHAAIDHQEAAMTSKTGTREQPIPEGRRVR